MRRAASGLAGLFWAAAAVAQPAVAPQPAPPKGDAAYAAYQRGRYLTALELARPQAEAGNAAAMTLMGEIYAQGNGVPQDLASAQKWYEAAAKLGDADAMFALGSLKMPQRTKPGDDKPADTLADKQAAVALFRQAAAKGNVAAAYNLGMLYLEGDVVAREPSVAADWFRKAAELDQEDALYALASLYADGNGVTKDAGERARLLQRAAMLGHVVATVEYAILVFNGLGVPKDEAAAALLFKKAALAGNAIAQNRLARILSAGRGLPQDKVAAATWHLAAKGQGLNDPVLERMLDELSPQDRAAAEARLRKWRGEGAS
ncbi:MAG TPA: tetratricopeptide repeat protein [Xanthobacteraceae bacterium]|nr:tetratricopeptide repeat protein [Xanthobacteraceae bacterium]